jgi:type I restriction enzyme S subunit
MLDLEPADLDAVQRILREHLPGCEVRAFGSRVQGTARRFSDLDLAVVAQAPVSLSVLEALRDAFSESNLPMRVDVVDLAAVSESFRRIVESHAEVVQEPSQTDTEAACQAPEHQAPEQPNTCEERAHVR